MSAMNRRTWSDATLVEVVPFAHSVADVLRKLGLGHIGGGNYMSIKAAIRRLNLDTSHWSGQGHRRGLPVIPQKFSPPLLDVLVEHSTYSRAALKKRLLREGLLKNECVACGLGTVWQCKPLVLVLDHQNGVHDDARIENLRLLCPNCNSQQPTFAGRNVQKRSSTPIHSCKTCGRALRQARLTGMCVSCVGLSRSRDLPGDNTKERVLADIPVLGLRGAARKYAVSHTTVRRWLVSSRSPTGRRHRLQVPDSEGSNPSVSTPSLPAMVAGAAPPTNQSRRRQ
jgi:Zn finger protein HypA/HybF involved in hydrogenase expression